MNQADPISTLDRSILDASPQRDSALALLKDPGLWVLCGIFLALGILSLNDTLVYTPDSARYLIWAKSLASFKGFYDGTEAEISRYVVHGPLYSILLLPSVLLFSTNIVAAKSITLLFGVLALIVFYLWITIKAGRVAALIGSAFLVINPLFIFLSTQVLSDIPFVVCMVVFFMLADRLGKEDEKKKGTAWLLVAVITAGVFLREIGLTLLLSATLYYLLRKEYNRALLVFTIPFLFYLMWYYRNEIFIAAAENPALRNTKLFVGHYFTTDNVSLVDEFLARVKSNFSVYGRMVGRLVLFPQHLQLSFPVLLVTDSFMPAARSVLSYAQYPLAVFQLALFGWGAWTRRRVEKTMLLFGLFMFFYFSLILLYPFNDVRFLMPLLILLLYFSVLGGADLVARAREGERLGKGFVRAAIGTGILLAIPNLLWAYNEIGHNLKYLRATQAEFESPEEVRREPEVYTRPFNLVGEWIQQHTDSSAVIACRWKELTFWLGSRKILEIDPLLQISLLELLFRDYGPTYAVVFVTPEGIRELEMQLAQSKRFAFETVYRAGNLEVIQLHDLWRRPGVRVLNGGDNSLAHSSNLTLGDEHTPPAERNIRYLFHHAFQLLDAGDNEKAIEEFQITRSLTRGNGFVVLMNGVALEFAGKLDEALSLFARFRSQQQAGPFLKHAWYHEELIDRLKKAQRDTSAEAKAVLYHFVSANYWDLGFRPQAFRMLDLSLNADSAFAPALVFGVYYALQDQDTAKAFKYVQRLRTADSSHTIVRPLSDIFAYFDSLRHPLPVQKQISERFEVAKLYVKVGLLELAVDQLLQIHDLDPNNTEALDLLGSIYELKRRYTPAILAFERVLALKPTDKDAQNALERLSDFQ